MYIDIKFDFIIIYLYLVLGIVVIVVFGGLMDFLDVLVVEKKWEIKISFKYVMLYCDICVY